MFDDLLKPNNNSVLNNFDVKGGTEKFLIELYIKKNGKKNKTKAKNGIFFLKNKKNYKQIWKIC